MSITIHSLLPGEFYQFERTLYAWGQMEQEPPFTGKFIESFERDGLTYLVIENASFLNNPDERVEIVYNVYNITESPTHNANKLRGVSEVVVKKGLPSTSVSGEIAKYLVHGRGNERGNGRGGKRRKTRRSKRSKRSKRTRRS